MPAPLSAVVLREVVELLTTGLSPMEGRAPDRRVEIEALPYGAQHRRNVSNPADSAFV